MNNEKRAGDKGMTSLSGSGMVSKSDERIVLIGTIEELNCYIGIIKADASCSHLTAVLERIQRTLRTVCEGVRSSFGKEQLPKAEETAFLEQETERLKTDTKEDIKDAKESLPGADRETAVFELAAAIARRAERALIAADRRFGVRQEAKRYMNRLADYFDSAAKYRASHPSENKKETEKLPPQQMQQVVRRVISEMGMAGDITLREAKILMEAVEEEAGRRGAKAVICVCNSHGNPVAVHVMDGAFLVSFDAAKKKAYTSAAVKMATLELAALAAPGQTFYGVDRLDDGKITLIGGGIPLLRDGVLCGAVGVSGGTGEEDHSLAKYAVDFYSKMC